MIISNGLKWRGETYLILITNNRRTWKFEIKKPEWLREWLLDGDMIKPGSAE